ncbi:MAG: hypothetical protein M0Q14_05770 [Tissierellaceae bacterium]|nr:hypothetical protein [Tissierellaceae bacterium]
MGLTSALKKILVRSKSKDYLNSDYKLSIKEKQKLIIAAIFVTFPVLLGIILILVN